MRRLNIAVANVSMESNPAPRMGNASGMPPCPLLHRHSSRRGTQELVRACLDQCGPELVDILFHR